MPRCRSSCLRKPISVAIVEAMKPGGQNPRGNNAAPFGRYSNNHGAGFRRGSTGPNAPRNHHHSAAAAPPHVVMTPQQRDEVRLRAGRLAAEYLVIFGELPPDALLQGRHPPPPPHAPFQGYQQRQWPPPRGHPWHEGPHPQHGFQASRSSAVGPIRNIAKRAVVRGGGGGTFRGRGGRFPSRRPGASGAAAPETAGEPGHGQGVAPGAGVGGVVGVRGDGSDATAPAGPSSGRQPSAAAHPGGAAHGQPETGQPGGLSNTDGPVGL